MDKNGDFKELEKIGLQLEDRMHGFKARMIPVPRISLGGSHCIDQGKEAFFQLYSKPIYASKHSIRCALIYFRADIRDLVRTFESTAKNLDVKLTLEQIEAKDDRRAVESI